eukprot:1743073-Pyramimonas_sp.AAC.1
MSDSQGATVALLRGVEVPEWRSCAIQDRQDAKVTVIHGVSPRSGVLAQFMIFQRLSSNRALPPVK